jgi:hypothetical protein
MVQGKMHTQKCKVFYLSHNILKKQEKKEKKIRGNIVVNSELGFRKAKGHRQTSSQKRSLTVQ